MNAKLALEYIYELLEGKNALPVMLIQDDQDLKAAEVSPLRAGQSRLLKKRQ